MNKTIIHVAGLEKRYGAFTAVHDVSFDVRQGEIFGLLGPNGAGKTTTLECLEGLRCADAGAIDVCGVNPARTERALRNTIGVQLQSGSYPAGMRVAEALRFFGAYHEAVVSNDLVDRFGLREKLNSQYRELSVGQQRRLALALAIAHRPQVLFLDEPTAGLDVETRNRLHEVMMELRSDGTAIVLATHDMAEAEKLADRIAILLSGSIVAVGTPMEITAAGSGHTKISVRSERGSLRAADVRIPDVSRTARQDDYDLFYSANPGTSVSSLLAELKERGDELIDLRVERPSLEDRFLEITAAGPTRRPFALASSSGASK